MKTVSNAIHLILIPSLAAAVTITVGYYPVVYTTTESQEFVVLNITIFDPPITTRPFTLAINTQNGTAGMLFYTYD